MLTSQTYIRQQSLTSSLCFRTRKQSINPLHTLGFRVSFSFFTMTMLSTTAFSAFSTNCFRFLIHPSSLGNMLYSCLVENKNDCLKNSFKMNIIIQYFNMWRVCRPQLVQQSMLELWACVVNEREGDLHLYSVHWAAAISAPQISKQQDWQLKKILPYSHDYWSCLRLCLLNCSFKGQRKWKRRQAEKKK